MIRRVVFSLAVLTATTYWANCSFPAVFDVCRLAEDAPVSAFSSSPPPTVFDDGTVTVIHGSACAESNEGDGQRVLKVEHTLPLPGYVTDATVFLNGWHVRYLRSDHHVTALGTMIGRISRDAQGLHWQAWGALADKYFDEPYAWCYYYTAIGWNAGVIGAAVDHQDAESYCEADRAPAAADKFFIADNEGMHTALSAFPTFLQSPALATGGLAVLPRGYGFSFGDADHHVLQLAYNLDHSEGFVEHEKEYRKALGELTAGTPASRVGSGFASVDTHGILKDNSARRAYALGQMVSGLGGTDVGVVQPPFSVLPDEDIGWDEPCITQSSPPPEVLVENVPFQYAIPMLTGWEVGYGCDDEHVSEVGVWLDEIRHDAAARTLRYRVSSILRDKNGRPEHYRRHKVTILGLRPLAGVTRRETPDLVPFSPSGTSAAAFCRLEQGRKLRVSVRNLGTADAGASRTTVTFGDKPVTVATPPISRGATVDLVIDVPAGCFTPDCFFAIRVDSGSQVDESGREGNNAASGSCIG